ncbi:MAG: hypothetical protein AseanaTS_20800 [Candidatus Pelagadaptatus aseana]
MDKRLLRREGLLQDFLKSEKFPCPHCSNQVRFPEKADTMASMGIFVAVILAPLFHFWEVQLMDTRYLFALGVAIFVAGSLTLKLEKAGKAADKTGHGDIKQ